MLHVKQASAVNLKAWDYSLLTVEEASSATAGPLMILTFSSCGGKKKSRQGVFGLLTWEGRRTCHERSVQVITCRTAISTYSLCLWSSNDTSWILTSYFHKFSNQWWNVTKHTYLSTNLRHLKYLRTPILCNFNSDFVTSYLSDFSHPSYAMKTTYLQIWRLWMWIFRINCKIKCFFVGWENSSTK